MTERNEPDIIPPTSYKVDFPNFNPDLNTMYERSRRRIVHELFVAGRLSPADFIKYYPNSNTPETPDASHETPTK